MRKSILTLLTIFTLCATLLFGSLLSAPKTPLLAQANAPAEPQSGSYACILTDDVFFYASPDENEGVFLLPKSYYVKILSYGKEYCQIEYLYDGERVKKLVGYAKTHLLTPVPYLPQQPYFYYVFELNYRIDEAQTGEGFLNEITLSCAYYGDYKIGSKNYCYVLRGESFGYVPKPPSMTLPTNTEYADYLESLKTPVPDETQPAASEKESSSPAQIAILVALCLLVPVLAALILKPPRRPPYETDPD